MALQANLFEEMRRAQAFLAERQRRNLRLVRQIDLIGELETTAEDLDALGREIAALIRTMTPNLATTYLTRQYPLALAEFLVAVGIYDYRHGDFWTPVQERTGNVFQVHRTQWGESFETTIGAYELAAFDELADERALRFVAKFLAHGGIPSYCLADFFERLLLRAVRGGGAEVSPAELVQQWSVSRTAFDGVDKPVRRFLRHGGAVAADFLGRCLDLAAAAVSGRPLPLAGEVGLPERVCTKFDEWWSTQRVGGRPVAATPLRRLVRPSLVYDPWAGDALTLVLPPEPAGSPDRRDRWRVSLIGATTWTRALDVTPTGLCAVVTRPAEVRLPAPFTQAEAVLDDGDEPVRAWRFAGVSRETPALVFQPGDGRLVAAERGLNAEPVWLVTAGDCELWVGKDGGEQSAPVREQFPALSGGWVGYFGHHIDLTGCRWLELRGCPRPLRLPVVPVGLDARPRLAGGTLLDAAGTSDDPPVYVGPPPALVLPLPFRAGERVAPARWRVQVRSLGEAAPRRERIATAVELPHAFRDDGAALVVDLAAADLLGPAPCGAFEVAARGPLGMDARFRLVVVPPISVRGHERLLVPDRRDGPPPALLRVRTAARVLAASGGSGPIAVDRIAHDEYELRVPAEAATVTLRVAPPAGVGGGQADLAVPLRRVRWGVSGVGGEARALTDRPLRISLPELEAAEAPALVLEMGRVEPGTRLAARLVDAAGRSIQAVPPRDAAQGHRLGLREFVDTARARSDPGLAVVVTIWPPGDYGPGLDVPVVQVTRRLRVSDLAVEETVDAAGRTVSVVWGEAAPLSHRVFRFWPLWRPWDPPRSYPVPDAARGAYAVTEHAADLRPGAYRVELAVEDPWAPAAVPTLPERTTPNWIDVVLGDDAERAAYLDALPERPRGRLERFLATRDPRHLTALAALADDDVPLAVEVLQAVIEMDESDALHDERALYLAKRLLGEAIAGRAATFETVADLAALANADERELARLRALVIELGLLRRAIPFAPAGRLSLARRRALWSLWPPLLCALEAGHPDPDESEGPAVLEVARTLLGAEAAALFGSGDDGSDAAPAGWRQPCGPPGPELRCPAPLLKQMLRELALVPTGLLDAESWTIVNAAWAIRLKEDRAAGDRACTWLKSCRDLALDTLDDLAAAGLGPAADLVRQRLPTANGDPFAVLPFVVGATALAERAVARGKLADCALLAEIERGYVHPPRDAQAAAAELYARDLCLMDLLLTPAASPLATSGDRPA